MNVYQKIVEVRKSIIGFTKDKKGYNFSYVTGGQVLSKIEDKMDELGLILEPHILTTGHATHEYQDKYNKTKIDFVVWGDMEYHWVNSDDPLDRAIVKWSMFGQQGDISQAFGSGLTYSERYFLLKYFGKPTDEDDPDAKNYDTKPEPKTDKKPVEPLKPEAELKPSARSQALYNIATSKGYTVASVVSSVRKYYNKSMDEMTDTEYKEVKGTYDAMLAQVSK